MNFLIPTIRFGAVASIAFFVFANEVFAAPVLTPPTAFGVSETSATLSVKAFNPVDRNTSVWLEWGDNPYPTNVIGMRDIFNEGYVEGYLRGNLEPGKTYYFRGAAMEGGVIVYTPVMSFATKNNIRTITTTTVVNHTNVVNTTTSINNTATTQTVMQRQTTAEAKNSAKSTTTTNTQTAAALGASSGLFPGTLIGWVALLIAMLLAVLVGHMIYEQTEKRKKKLNPHERETDEEEK